MALHFDYKNVVGPTINPGDPALMHPVLHTIIMSTMVLDLGRLTTDKDVAEYAFRIGLYQRFFGPLLQWEHGKTKANITIEDVKQYKGLSCNVSNTTRAAWLKRFSQMCEREEKSYPTSNTSSGVQGPIDLIEALPEKPTAIDVAQFIADKYARLYGKVAYRSGDEYSGWVFRVKADGAATLRAVASGNQIELQAEPARHLADTIEAAKDEDAKDRACASAFAEHKTAEEDATAS